MINNQSTINYMYMYSSFRNYDNVIEDCIIDLEFFIDANFNKSIVLYINSEPYQYNSLTDCLNDVDMIARLQFNINVQESIHVEYIYIPVDNSRSMLYIQVSK